MTRPEQVKAFAREFINGKRTNEQRTAIREALFQLTGEQLRITCETCYVEAIFKILKLMERKPCKYRLLKGAVLHAFGDADKLCTNDNLTDELAEWHLKHTRGAASLFDKMPDGAPQYVDPAAPVIVPPKNVVIVPPKPAAKKPAAKRKTK